MKHIFMVNIRAGKQGFATKLRKDLAAIPGLEYYVFNTRRAGDEAELVKIIQNLFEGEELRFYACGGSGTMRNMLNGFESLENIEVAFFPCGLTNDFLKSFEEDASLFYDIHELINGKVIKVDYLKTNCGVALNTFSFGLDTEVVQKTGEFMFLKLFSNNLPYTMAIITALLSTRHQKYIIDTDDWHYEGSLMEFFFGNGNVMGGNMYVFPHADTRDGVAQFRTLKPRPGLTCIPALLALTNKKYDYVDKISMTGTSTRLRIRSADGGEVRANHDGELIRGVNEWQIEVIPRGLKLVVPKGVHVNE